MGIRLLPRCDLAGNGAASLASVLGVLALAKLLPALRRRYARSAPSGS